MRTDLRDILGEFLRDGGRSLKVARHSLPCPSLLFPSLPLLFFPSLPFFPTLTSYPSFLSLPFPLELGPLNPAREGLGSAVSSPSSNRLNLGEARASLPHWFFGRPWNFFRRLQWRSAPMPSLPWRATSVLHLQAAVMFLAEVWTSRLCNEVTNLCYLITIYLQGLIFRA